MANKIMVPKNQQDNSEQDRLVINIVAPNREFGIGIVSLILGICGLFFCWLIPLLGMMFGLMAWIIGNFANKQNQRFGVAGIVTGIIAFVISIAIWIYTILFVLGHFY